MAVRLVTEPAAAELNVKPVMSERVTVTVLVESLVPAVVPSCRA